MNNAKAERDQVLQEGRDAVENQNLIGLALGYSLDRKTSNFRVLADTEEEARRQANIIMSNARKAAKDAKKAGLTEALSSAFGSAASMANMF
jgi:hypothetical protein